MSWLTHDKEGLFAECGTARVTKMYNQHRATRLFSAELEFQIPIKKGMQEDSYEILTKS